MERLASAARGDMVVFAKSARGPEPLFALWPVSALARVEAALADGDLAVHRVAAEIGRVDVEIDTAPGEPDWSFNLNNPDDLARARAALSGNILGIGVPSPAGEFTCAGGTLMDETGMVPLAGIEPALLAESDFESDASTSSAIGARVETDGADIERVTPHGQCA